MTAGPKVKKLYLAGAHVWAKWSIMGKPRYELYEFIGYNTTLNQYYFKHRKNGTLVVWAIEQIVAQTGGFRPFLLDTFRLDSKHLVTIG